MSHGWWCAALLTLTLLSEAVPIARTFSDLQYNETINLLSQLAVMAPGLAVFDVDALNKIWNTPTPVCKLKGDCTINPLVRLTGTEFVGDRITPPGRGLPAVLLSGVLHGNERLGAAIITYLIQWLVSEQPRNLYIRWLLSKRDIYALPFANVDGYLYSQREDRGHDPNRDSPFAQASCPQSRTGEVLYKLILSKLFTSGITFHGGMRSLTYAWGSPRHYVNQKSSESPDNTMLSEIARELQKAAGVIPVNITNPKLKWLDAIDSKTVIPNSPYRFFYSVGATNDMVYPVEGSVEDWAYAGGWEVDETVGCKSAGSEHLRFPFFLVETDDNKNPSPSVTYGESSQINYPNPYSGHISRNIRLTMRLIELTRPEIIFNVSVQTASEDFNNRPRSRIVVARKEQLDAALQNDLEGDFEMVTESETDKMNDVLKLEAFFTGCSSVQSITVTIGEMEVYHDTQVYRNNTLCSSFGGFSLVNQVMAYVVEIPLNPRASGVVQMHAMFDQHWAKQINPDPPLPPQTHLVRARLDPMYRAVGTKSDIIAPVLLYPDRDNSAVGLTERLSLDVRLEIYGDFKKPARLNIQCAEKDDIECAVSCKDCSILAKYACPKSKAHLSVKLQDQMRSNNLFRIPLADGMFQGTLSHHNLTKTPDVSVEIWCAHEKVIHLNFMSCEKTFCEACYRLSKVLRNSGFIATKCEQYYSSMDSLDDQLAMIYFRPVIGVLGFSVWFIVVALSHIIFKRI